MILPAPSRVFFDLQEDLRLVVFTLVGKCLGRLARLLDAPLEFRFLLVVVQLFLLSLSALVGELLLQGFLRASEFVEPSEHRLVEVFVLMPHILYVLVLLL